MHTHAGSTLYNPVPLTFDLWTSGSMHAELLPKSICVPSLVLTAEVISLQSVHTQSQIHLIA